MTAPDTRNLTWRELLKLPASEVWRLTRSIDTVGIAAFVVFHGLAIVCAVGAGAAPLPVNVLFMMLLPVAYGAAWWVWLTSVTVPVEKPWLIQHQFQPSRYYGNGSLPVTNYRECGVVLDAMTNSPAFDQVHCRRPPEEHVS